MIKLNFIRQFATVLLGCLLSVQTSAQQYKTEFLFSGTAPENIRKTMQTNANVVFAEMHRAFFDKTKSGLTFSLSNVENNETIKRILTMWGVSHFRCIETRVITRVLKSSDRYQVRNIPVYFENDTIREKYQDFVIEFTLDGKVSDLYFALPQHQYAKIMANSVEVEELRQRQIVVDFAERYRTAYNRKNLALIESVFSEDALIITGTVVTTKKGDTPKLLNPQHVVYNQYNKQQYINRLRNIFNGNATITVEFDDIVVNRHRENPNIYGVTLRQNWKASGGYQDEGWLFLMIDFSDENNPLIWVRTWQPLKVYETGADIHYAPDDIFGFSNFPVR